ncbi:hypothetical protein QWZ08_16995 [Ferruginibacter paludis]|uniref:hypothetical protein n=1 Tax=Ferruginibacter paludis TaxID=1310417 RepID=UPI0025B58CED|nr:hypothetical protein [Ferruginibacter paludis]MDN3657351.1 hypothetical protein [Ferruginibacter paludis]
MDFAFAPGASGYDIIMRKMFTNRASTTLINKRGINSVKDFFNHLASAGVVATPLTDILIGTHGNESGWMNVQLDPAFDAHTTYEAMESAINAPTRTCQLADAIINPRPVDSNNNPIDPHVFIRGCRIGVMNPFIEKFKEVINGLSTTDIGVCAPLFYHEVYNVRQGVFESFNYDFHIFSKTAVADKAALVALFDGLNAVDTYGTAITTAQWNGWIKTNITRDADPLVLVNLAATPVTNLLTLRSGFYRHRFQTIISSIRVDPAVGALPTDPAGIATFLKQQLNNLAANPGTNPFGLQLQSTHPFPLFTRYEYASIDEMVDGLTWTVNTQSRVFVGKRHEYYVCPPVTANNANNELIYNFYATQGGGATSKKNFADDAADYFNAV